MRITVEFDTEEEFKARIKNPRGTKGGSGDEDTPVGQGAQAPAPLMPPQSGTAFQQPAAFTPPQQQPAGFPGAQSSGDPAVTALVNRIVARIDGAISSGQPADAVLTWFRSQCGAEAANATMDQVKQVFLPKLALPSLENIAKLMNA